MENILPYKEKSLIFDLKGSKVSRLVKGIENPSIPPLGQVLKDENFLLYNKKLALKEVNKIIKSSYAYSCSEAYGRFMQDPFWDEVEEEINKL